MVRTLPLCYLAKISSRPLRAVTATAVFPTYREPCRLEYIPPFTAMRGGAKVHARFIIETERARVSHRNQTACLSTPSQVHPATRGVCLSSCPAVSPYGAGRSEPRLLSRLTNILHLSDSPPSPPPKWSPRRGSNPHASGHIGQHRRADVLRLSRSGTVQLSHLPPAFHAIGFIPRREMPLAKDPAPPMQY